VNEHEPNPALLALALEVIELFAGRFETAPVIADFRLMVAHGGPETLDARDQFSV
jgi:hypothetical protein